MTDPAALQKLVTWLSPAFPVGSFAWSAGLETAIAEGVVRDSASLENWILGSLRHGGIKTDAILLAEAHRRARDGDLAELADLGLALTAARERWLETTITADSYRRAVAHWPTAIVDRLPDPCPYPVVVGAIAAGHGIGLLDTLLAFLTATVHGQISVAVRLVPLGQSDGLRVMAGLEAEIAALAGSATNGGLADLGGLAYAADIAQMRHETLEPRIFRS
jgi:urease accessory protein